jgi:hypothetical protein
MAIILLGIAGCARTPSVNDYKKAELAAAPLADENSVKQIESAFIQADKERQMRAKWFDRSEAVDLNIIGVVFEDGSTRQHVIFKKFKALLENVAADKTLLDRLGDEKISHKYRSITFTPYRVGSHETEKVDAAYAQRLYGKERLNDVLRTYGDQSDYQELSIGLNINALDAGALMLEGYKSVKYGDKKENALYYHLNRPLVDDVDGMIVDALLAMLKLEIPEYVSIDRKDIIENKALKIVNQNADGTHTATVYKMKTDIEIEKLDAMRRKAIETRPQDAEQVNKKYDALIDNIRSSNQWIKYQSRQLLHTTPVTQSTIDTLHQHGFLDSQYDADTLSPLQAQKIAVATGTQLPDFYLTLSFDLYRNKLNRFGINIAEVNKVLNTYYIKGEKLAEYESSEGAKRSREAAFSKVTNAAVVLSSLVTFGLSEGLYTTREEANYTGIEEDLQQGKFYPASQFAYAGIGVDTVYKENFGNYERSLYTVARGKSFYLHEGTYEIGFVNEKETEKVDFYDMRTRKLLYSKPVSAVDAMKESDKKYQVKFQNILENFDDYLAEGSYYSDEQGLITTKERFKRFVDFHEKQTPSKQLVVIWNGKFSDQAVHGTCNAVIDASYGRGIEAIKIKISDENYLQSYRCSDVIDLFHEDKLVKRMEAEADNVLSMYRFSDELTVVSTLYSTKIWSNDVLNFMIKEF